VIKLANERSRDEISILIKLANQRSRDTEDAATRRRGGRTAAPSIDRASQLLSCLVVAIIVVLRSAAAVAPSRPLPLSNPSISQRPHATPHKLLIDTTETLELILSSISRHTPAHSPRLSRSSASQPTAPSAGGRAPSLAPLPHHHQQPPLLQPLPLPLLCNHCCRPSEASLASR